MEQPKQDALESDKEKILKLKKYRKNLIQSAITMVFCLGALIYSIASFSWFSSSNRVTADGMTTSVFVPPVISLPGIIGGSGEGDNRVTVTVNPDMTSEDTPPQKLITPGSFGSFTFQTVSSKDFFNIHPFCTAEDDDFKYTLSTSRKAQLLNYMNNHILFFTAFADGVYSGWIAPGGFARIASTPNEAEEISVYWIWVNSYLDLISPGQIAEADRTAILSFIDGDGGTNPSHFEDFFDVRGDTGITSRTGVSDRTLSRYYDNVDENIGNGVGRIFFEVTFENSTNE